LAKNRPSDRPSISASKARTLAAAKREWPFLPDADLAAVETEADLARLVQTHSGRTPEEAVPLVRHWMELNRIAPSFGLSTQTKKAVSDWDSEGGAPARRE
jgi:hypothetical protein